MRTIDDVNGRLEMRTAKELTSEAIALPVEERASLIDTLLRSMTPPDAEVDRKWTEVAKRRLAEHDAGQVKAIPGDEVFARIWERFGE